MRECVVSCEYNAVLHAGAFSASDCLNPNGLQSKLAESRASLSGVPVIVSSHCCDRSHMISD